MNTEIIKIPFLLRPVVGALVGLVGLVVVALAVVLLAFVVLLMIFMPLILTFTGEVKVTRNGSKVNFRL